MTTFVSKCLKQKFLLSCEQLVGAVLIRPFDLLSDSGTWVILTKWPWLDTNHNLWVAGYKLELSTSPAFFVERSVFCFANYVKIKSAWSKGALMRWSLSGTQLMQTYVSPAINQNRPKQVLVGEIGSMTTTCPTMQTTLMITTPNDNDPYQWPLKIEWYPLWFHTIQNLLSYPVELLWSDIETLFLIPLGFFVAIL
jgi:hypothetical protein